MEPSTDRQRTVARYCAEYSAGRYDKAVQVFTDDVRWILLGVFDVTGRDAYRANMTNPAAVGDPDIRVTRYFEDGDAVIAEGTVGVRLTEGGNLRLGFLDVFEFRGDLVCEKRSYVMNAEPHVGTLS